MADKDVNQNQNGEQQEEQQAVKVKLKDRIKNALDKERKFSIGGIVKGVAFIAAIPIAVAVGKGIERAKNNELLETTAYDPQPALPDDKIETIDVVAEEEPVYEDGMD